VSVRLDLLRHGAALPATSDGDEARSLSESGRSAVARIAAEYGQRNWRPERLFASPLRRAQETASIVARTMALLEIETLDELAPDGHPSGVVAALVRERLQGFALLVGHQPLLGELASHLTGAPVTGLSPGAMVSLEITAPLGRGSGRVIELLHPDHLP